MANPLIAHDVELDDFAQAEGGGAFSRYSPAASTISEPQQELFFADGVRRIDFVLVYQKRDPPSPMSASFENKRAFFEENLLDEGLQLEREEKEEANLVFVKIHAPLEVLKRYAELMKIRMPMKEEYEERSASKKTMRFSFRGATINVATPNAVVQEVGNACSKVFGFLDYNEAVFPPRSKTFTAVYSRDKEYLFKISDDMFSPAKRITIVDFILKRKAFVKTNQGKTEGETNVGIEKLLNEGVYDASFPLHEGDVNIPGSPRYDLRKYWGSLWMFYKMQPLDHIRDYFGVKIGLYFAWLGYYTFMLVPASIVGLICFIYGWLSLPNDPISQDVCDQALNVTMCPLCDKFCGFWYLNEICLHAKITYLVDNPSTLFFAVFMSFWSALFFEFWKRYRIAVTHRWDLTGFNRMEEPPRPQYLSKLKHINKRKMNYVTRQEEPAIPYWSLQVPMYLCSFSAVMLLILLALVAIFGVILYRMSTLAALSVQSDDNILTAYAMIFTTVTAACLNLVCIMIFQQAYYQLAVKLTEMEIPRTQSEFDDSLTLKIYLLQFVNYYSSIFYIAFFKGKVIGYPGNYHRIFGFRQEECGPGGCLLELFIQLAIIMIGKQAMNTIMELVMPIFWKWVHLMRSGLRRANVENLPKSRLLKDLKLMDFSSDGLFTEYLEMVIQFGFVTIFVSAFPLAPLFALLNNIFEMRLDAAKLLTWYRRPVAQRVLGIGIWYDILDAIGKLAVLSNAFIIAFTSNFIPRLVYELTLSPAGDAYGYVNNSLAFFNISDFPQRYAVESPGNTTVCRYVDYRHPFWVENKYEHTRTFWHILAARFAFIVIFQNVVFFMINMIRWLIPDVPKKLAEQIAREEFLTNELIMAQELRRAKESAVLKRSCSHVGKDAVTPEPTDFGRELRKRTTTTGSGGGDAHGSFGSANGAPGSDVESPLYPTIGTPGN